MTLEEIYKPMNEFKSREGLSIERLSMKYNEET